MITRKTLFVVGAGASREFGLPVGSELQKKIAQLVDLKFDDFGSKLISGDSQILHTIRNIAGPEEVNAYQKAAWQIRDGVSLANSIDNFMDTHRSNELLRTIGRLAIVKAIASAERTSSLKVDMSNTYNNINWSKVENTWIFKLFKRLQVNRPKEECHLFFKNASFVIFNYDRCVEHFFFQALQTYYEISAEAASEIVARADIIHPYGTIGRLDWEFGSPEPGVPYGPTKFPLEHMAGGIRTYTDQILDIAAVDYLRSLVVSAETICFLGFSYQEENLELLTPEQECGATLIGTAYGISDFDIEHIKRGLDKRLWASGGKKERQMHLDNKLKCSALLDKFSRAFG